MFLYFMSGRIRCTLLQSLVFLFKRKMEGGFMLLFFLLKQFFTETKVWKDYIREKSLVKCQVYCIVPLGIGIWFG